MPSENYYLAHVIKKATDSISRGNKKVSLTSILTTLQYASDFPSLEQISNLLTKWNYENAALKLAPENINEIPTPFIAHITDNGGRFILVEKRDNVGIIGYNGKDYQNLDYEQFLKSWSGYVLLLEASDLSGEPHYLRKRIREVAVSSRHLLLLVFVFSTAVAVSYFLPSSLKTFYFLHLVLSSAGLCLSAILIWLDTAGKDSEFKDICKIGDQFDCHSIQQASRVAFFGIFSWSEVGLVYFFSLVVTLLLSSLTGTTAQNLSAIACLDASASLFLFYFLYHQIKGKEKWCLLCLGVQIVLLLTVALDYSSIPYTPTSHVSWSVLVFSALLCIITGLTLIPFWYKYIEAINDQKELKRLLSDVALFKEKLDLQEGIKLPENLPGLKLGSMESANVLTFITNPYCNPCIRAHKYLNNMLEQTPQLQVKIIAIAAADPEKKSRKIVSHWIAMQEQNMEVGQALTSWYESKNKNYENFSKKHPVQVDDDHIILADQYSDWAEQFGFTTTPAFYLNGKRIPEPYQVQNLKYLINNL